MTIHDDVRARKIDKLLLEADAIQQLLDHMTQKISPGLLEYMKSKRKQLIAAAVALRLEENSDV